MSALPSTLWGAINRAKIDIRKYHLEQDLKKKEKLKKLAEASMANADKVVGPGPHKFMSSRSEWRREVLFLNYYDDDARIGRYWQDDKEHWNLETVPSWAVDKTLKVQEPALGETFVVNGIQRIYAWRPEHQDR
uniref:Uncharacterized protein n=1 Tax=viral metagenome TaxID=1070528 RepID=A0A6C0F5S0_9ZZZZ